MIYRQYEKELVNSHIKAALSTLQACRQLNTVKLAISNLTQIEQVINHKDTILAHRTNCYVEPEKKPIDFFSNAELLQEIQKRLNTTCGPATA